MKTPLLTHLNIDQLIHEVPLLYYSKSYLKSQQHDQFVCYESQNFFFPVSIVDSSAISIPRSPFGSFFSGKKSDQNAFSQFLDAVKKDLKSRNIKKLTIYHPPSIYAGFVSEKWLRHTGFKKDFSDINQHICLNSTWKEGIHKMQARKIEFLAQEGFEFRQIGAEKIDIVYQFILACRQVQGLNINISLALLQKLSDTTQAYHLFGVFRENNMSSVCVSVKITDKIAYYYLPATSPTFKSHSPMVLLIAGMVGHYRSRGFEYLDMGMSSIRGQPQEGLKVFKERMGARETPKATWSIQI